MKILIANRGEIARRVIATAHRLGHTTVAVYADPDAEAPFVAEATEAVHIGPAALSSSYLSIPRLLDAAASTGADAVHPGYGFLSENAPFARAVVDAGLVWVGPSPAAIDSMGSKIDARQLATAAGVPVIPGYDVSQVDDDLRAAAEAIGYPILVKAAAGGGGKGIRIATVSADFDAALGEARTEAERSFGDDKVIVERYIERPRHIEVQIVGDKHGDVIHLGTRECSVQRRYQKVLEEAPAPNLPEHTHLGLCAAAVDLATSIGYDSTGTVEFIVDDAALDADPAAFFFLEMNTRLQVEHPVTEAITGIDLVELQLAVAKGDPLPLRQRDVRVTGHAFEARINAEDASADFAPQTGTISHLSVPSDVRWDSGIEAGSIITPHYDPMVAKLIVHGPDRSAARNRLVQALDRVLIGGVTTNTGFHRWLMEQPPVVEGRVTTRFLDETEIPDTTNPAEAARDALGAWHEARRQQSASGSWTALGAFRVTAHRPSGRTGLRDHTGSVHDVPTTAAATPPSSAHVDLGERLVVVNLAGQSSTFEVLHRSEHWAPDDTTGHGHAGAIVAPFPAVIAEVTVSPGQIVAGGDTIVVIEAMKMLHTLAAAGPGTVDEVRVDMGQQVESNQVLVTFVTDEENQQ